MIHRLFPAAERHVGGTHYLGESKAGWLRERRVASEEILKLYLERVAGTGFKAFVDSEHAWQLMNDREKLDEFLRSIEPEKRQDVIAALEIYENEFRPEHVVPGIVVLLNLLTELPEQRTGMFDLGARLTVTRVTYRLLRSLSTPEAVHASAREILPHLASLSAKLELISDVGYREGVGHKLVSEEAAAELEREWRAQVRSLSAADLAAEPNPLAVLLTASRETSSTEAKPVVPDDAAVTWAVLRGARSDARIQSMGSRNVRREPRLAWDALIEVYGDETTLKARVTALREDLPEGNDLLALAERYASGWRPRDFGEPQ
jgi:hypothetical protein